MWIIYFWAKYSRVETKLFPMVYSKKLILSSASFISKSVILLILISACFNILNELLFECFIIHSVFYPFAFCVGSGSSSSALGWWHEKSARLTISFEVMIWRSSLPVFFCKRKWTRRLGCFCFPVRFVHCKYNTPILKKEYSKPTTFLPKTYRKPTFFEKTQKKSASNPFLNSLPILCFSFFRL